MSKPKSQWQPIETAPRDGTRVIVAGGTLHSWPTTAEYDEGWRILMASDYVEHPSHWMPIPPLPEGER